MKFLIYMWLIAIVVLLILLKSTSYATAYQITCPSFVKARAPASYSCPANYALSGTTCVPNTSTVTGLTCDSPYFTPNFATNKCVPI